MRPSAQLQLINQYINIGLDSYLTALYSLLWEAKHAQHRLEASGYVDVPSRLPTNKISVQTSTSGHSSLRGTAHAWISVLVPAKLNVWLIS